LRPATRAIGMGLFYTLYYVTMMLGPAVGGACAKWGRQRGCGIRFRRRRDPGLSAAVLGLQSDCSDYPPYNVNAHTSCNRR